MSGRKSMANKSMLLNSPIYSSPISSLPLRRKSIIPQEAISPTLSENDDEAERLALRREIINTLPQASSANHNNEKRRSLGLSFLVNMPASQMSERITQCIKLGTENKINPKNAFSLEMIDFMTYMIKKKDTSMSNLQLASTSLDVSTKIYGFRVDGVHMDILKMVSGLYKQDKDNKDVNRVEPMDCQDEIENSEDRRKQEKKKRKRNKQQIFATVEALKGNVEIDKPSLITMEADLQTTDMLYQVILPNHANSGFYPHSYNDVLIDTVNSRNIQDNGILYNIPKIGNFSHMEICPPLFYFDFHNWNADDEPIEVLQEQNNESKFQFDLEASLSREDDHVSTGIDYFNIEVTEEENVNRCAMIPNQVENIVDFCKVLTNAVSSKESEYSFIQKSLNIHWAGPSHWKVTNLKKVLFSNGADVQERCHAQARKKKEIELSYDSKTIKRVNDKFLPSQSAKLHSRTAKIEWNEEILILPPDEHYDIIQASKLYLHTTKLKCPGQKDSTNASSVCDNISNDCINDNINDSYFNIENEECQGNKENEAIDVGIRSEDEGVFGTQIPFTGDNLVIVPKLTNKLTIAYSVRAKKVDMKQLKQSIWKCLRNKNSEIVQEQLTEAGKMDESKHFSDIYKALPSVLTKANNEALSFPISFVSLLHLANEKTLKISCCNDMADLTVQQD